MGKFGEVINKDGTPMPLTTAIMEQYGLTYKQAKFVEYYYGDGTAAALKAGYSKGSAGVAACLTLKMEKVKQALYERDLREKSKTIADRKERQEFWTNIIRNECAPLLHRLRASELLGKSEGDFLEKNEEGFPNGTPHRPINIIFKTKDADILISSQKKQNFIDAESEDCDENED
ncbi:MAG: terminase small subunit [Clostridia bacterium]|nr:terminase small subunit [Clostridia bacterium]